MNPLEIGVEWVTPRADEEAVGVEQWTWAEVRIDAGERVVTRHRGVDGAPRDTLRMAVSWLAEWIVDCWVSLAWEVHAPFPFADGPRPVPALGDAERLWARFTGDRPAIAVWQHRHTLGHGSSTAPLPSIVLLPGVHRYGLQVDPPAAGLGPNVDLLLGEDAVVWGARTSVRGALQDLVDATLRRAHAHREASRWASWLATRWREAQDKVERGDCRRKTLFGEIGSATLEAVDAARVSGLEGLLLDMPIVVERHWLDDLTRQLAPAKARRARAALPVRPDAAGAVLTPHEQGYKLANRLRHHLKTVDAPLTSVRRTAAELGVAVRPIAAGERFRTAVVDAGAPAILWNADEPALARVAPSRFAIAAAIGRLLFDRDETASTFGAANGDYSRLFETRRANAFAAELLLPKRALVGAAAGVEFADLCADYGISTSAARWHIHNRVGHDDWRLALERNASAARGSSSPG